MPEGNARFVGVAIGEYAEQAALPHAVENAELIAAALEERHHYTTVLLPDFERGDLQDAIDENLPENAPELRGGTLIVSWTGHGEVGPDGTLRLIGRSGGKDVEVAEARKLGEWAARTGAAATLVLIDTCYSGDGAVDAITIANRVASGHAGAGARWFCVVAASLGDEPARAGALAKAVAELLREGPAEPDATWGRTRPRIQGDDFVNALLDSWTEQRQSPRSVTTRGTQSWDLVENPFYEGTVPDQPVEHLLRAARGSSGEESFFSGRETVLEDIVSWMDQRAPGLFVVTGPPGCGKSAVLGRIVSLSSSGERARLLAAEDIPGALDPDEGSVAADLHARGVNLTTAANKLGAQLGIGGDPGSYAVLAEAEARRNAGAPPVLVIDGLDEAGEHAEAVAVELIRPLSRQALVLVGTRDVPRGAESGSLLAALGPTAETIDLGDDPAATLRDVRTYVVKRLEGIDDSMDPALVAEELAPAVDAEAGSTEGPFLLARLVTSQLRDQPVDTNTPAWRMELATSVENALERDVRGAVLTVEGAEHPAAARELLYALALSHGSGFPADDVWPAVASAVSATGTSYGRTDAYTVLEKLGRHVVAGTEGTQPVYRIAHQRLVDHLVQNAGKPDAGAIAESIFRLYSEVLDAGFDPRYHTYLWRYAWWHLAEAGPPGIERLRELVERDRDAFLPDLAAGLEFAASQSWWIGGPAEAVEFQEEGVEIRRELGDPMNLATALFNLASYHSSAGDSENADEAAAEGSFVARGIGEEAEGRAVLAAALTARTWTQMRAGEVGGATLLAAEAVRLAELEYESDAERWPALAAALTAGATTAAASFALERGAESAQRAVALVDEHGEEDDEGAYALLSEALSTLAGIQFTQAQSVQPGPDGAIPTADASAARRIVDAYREAGPKGTLADIATAKCLQFLAMSGFLDQMRGVQAADPASLIALLDESVDVMDALAERNADAAIVLASALISRGEIEAPTVDLETAAASINLAEQRLRPWAERSSAAAAQLGLAISMQTAGPFNAAMAGAPVDVPALIARCDEAVGFLERGGAIVHRAERAQGLARLAMLHLMNDREDLSQIVRDASITQWRQLLDVVPSAAQQLAGHLTDQSGSIFATRPIEAIDYATEALGLAEQLPQDDMGTHAIIGLAELNRAAAKMALDSTVDVRHTLKRAIERLEPLADNPVFAGALATAYSNLAQVDLLQENFADALPSAARAMELFERPDLSPVVKGNIPLGRISLGHAQRGTGDVDEGTATLRRGITELQERLANHPEEIARFAAALDIAGPGIWDEVLAQMADQPSVTRMLQVARKRPSEDLHLTVDAVITALDEIDDTERRSVREIARQQRALAEDAFDAAWRAAAGDVTDWLLVPIAREPLVVAWWNTPTWALSKEYLRAHPELLEPSTDILIEEFRFDGPDERGLVDRHLGFLAAAREVGIDAAYAPTLARVALQAWRESDDLETHLAENPDLLEPAVAEAADADAADGDFVAATMAGILELVKRREKELAFSAMDAPGQALAHLQPAWRSTDVPRLAALAAICLMSDAADEATQRYAAVALAIARVLEDKDDQAGQLIDFLAETTEDRDEYRTMIADAIAYHPGKAAGLGRLLAALVPPDGD